MLEQTESRSRDWNYLNLGAGIHRPLRLNKQNLAQEIETRRWQMHILIRDHAWTNRISLKRLKPVGFAACRIPFSGLNKQNLAQEIETRVANTLLALYIKLEQTESRSRDWNCQIPGPPAPPRCAWTNRISLKRLKRQWRIRRRSSGQRLNKQNLAQEIETTMIWSHTPSPCGLEQTESRSRDWNSRDRPPSRLQINAWTNRISLKRLKLDIFRHILIDAKRLNKQNLAQEIETFTRGLVRLLLLELEQTESRSRDWN